MNTKRSKRSSDPTSASRQSYQPATSGEMPRPLEEGEPRNYSTAPLASEVAETARSAGRAVREQAAALVSDVGHELGKSVEDQKSRGVEAVRALAAAVNTAARELEQQSPEVARYVRNAADSLQSLSGNIEGRDINELIRNASDFAKSRPTLFFAGAVAAGFAMSRFLKSSARHESTGGRWDAHRDESDMSELAEPSGGTDYANP